MFKQILVPVDGSPTANRGLKLAVALAREHGATLHVLHVIDDMAITQGFGGIAYAGQDTIDGLLSGMRTAGRKILARAGTIAAAQGQAVRPLLVETFGQSVAQTILNQARKTRAELIVLGTHGRRGLTRLVMGSDAEAVVREAGVPVLLVRSPAARTARGAGASAEARVPVSNAGGKPAATGAAALRQPARRKRAA